VIDLMHYTETADYLEKVIDKEVLSLVEEDYPKVQAYISQLIGSFKNAVQKIDSSNFWEVFPEILGYDSRFVLLNSLIMVRDEFLTEDEIIQMIETDYTHLNKESCGYSLRDQEHESLVFNVK
jgi:hypothetical protein